jgi:hypothetical protein
MLLCAGSGAKEGGAARGAADLRMPGGLGRRHGGIARGWQSNWLIPVADRGSFSGSLSAGDIRGLFA